MSQSYCPMCDTVWESPGKCRCKFKLATPASILANLANDDIAIWNAAIEAAANRIEGAPMFAAEIRKLKR